MIWVPLGLWGERGAGGLRRGVLHSGVFASHGERAIGEYSMLIAACTSEYVWAWPLELQKLDRASSEAACSGLIHLHRILS